MKEFHEKKHGKYEGDLDNLLYYYSFFYNMIQDVYTKEQREFWRINNYIKKDSTDGESDKEPTKKQKLND
jgi:hypothetical protein